MAVAPTGAIYKALKFDGVSSRTYGVYITGEAVYNAPERDVEMITIPGRSGSFALDNGRFENITVTYPAGIFAETEADFRDAISEFRNFLCSRKGYVRLKDEYNPNEYRMAVYKSGLEVEPAMLKAGEFDIVFDCKPQRWLTSGETKQTIATSGDTITNPTLFEASPLLEVTGYGDININNQQIEIVSGPIGNVLLLPYDDGVTSPENVLTWNNVITFDTQYADVGDTISTTIEVLLRSRWNNVIDVEATHISGSADVRNSGHYPTYYLITTYNLTLSYGTSVVLNDTIQWVFNAGIDTQIISISCSYDGDSTITTTMSTDVLPSSTKFRWQNMTVGHEEVWLNSSQSALGNPIYLDLDFGEAYKIENGSVVSVSNAVVMPANLPTLAPGSNAITFDNTVTDLKITPRWWKV